MHPQKRQALEQYWQNCIQAAATEQSVHLNKLATELNKLYPDLSDRYIRDIIVQHSALTDTSLADILDHLLLANQSKQAYIPILGLEIEQAFDLGHIGLVPAEDYPHICDDPHFPTEAHVLAIYHFAADAGQVRELALKHSRRSVQVLRFLAHEYHNSQHHLADYADSTQTSEENTTEDIGEQVGSFATEFQLSEKSTLLDVYGQVLSLLKDELLKDELLKDEWADLHSNTAYQNFVWGSAVWGDAPWGAKDAASRQAIKTTLITSKPERRWHITIAGESRSGQEAVFVNAEDRQHIYLKTGIQNICIDAAVLTEFQSLGLETLSALLRKTEKELSSLEKALMRMLYWFSSSKEQTNLEHRFLSLITCLEVLFTPESGSGLPISAAIAESVALLKSTELEERKVLAKYIKKLYEDRSHITHGRETTIDVARVRELEDVVCWAIRFALEHISSFAKIETLKQHIQDLKFA